MFSHLGIAGACSLLGGLSLPMCTIPFIFIWQGQRIRANSRFCIALKERKEDLQRRIDEQRRRRLASSSVEADAKEKDEAV